MTTTTTDSEVSRAHPLRAVLDRADLIRSRDGGVDTTGGITPLS